MVPPSICSIVMTRTYGSSAFSCRCFFTCSHDRNTEGFRTIAKENQRLGSHVDQLIVVFGRKKTISFFSMTRSSPLSPFMVHLPSMTKKVSGDWW